MFKIFRDLKFDISETLHILQILRIDLEKDHKTFGYDKDTLVKALENIQDYYFIVKRRFLIVNLLSHISLAIAVAALIVNLSRII